MSQHVASQGTATRRRRKNDLFYPPRTHCDDKLRLPKRKPVATNDDESEIVLGSTAHRHRVSDVFHHPEPAQRRQPLQETGMPMMTLQRRMSELFYRPASSARGDSQKSDTLTAREPAPCIKPQRRMSELFYQPPTRTQSESNQCRAWPPSIKKSSSLPLTDSGLTTFGTQDACHDGGQVRMRQAEQKDLTERLERLNSLSAVIEHKLQEQKEYMLQEQKKRKTLRLIHLLASEAMHGDKTI